MDSSFFVVFLPIISGFVSGSLAYLVFHWTHIRFQLGLEYRLSDLEGRVGREVKIRASEKFHSKKNDDAELLIAAKAEANQEELNLSSWRQRAFTR